MEVDETTTAASVLAYLKENCEPKLQLIYIEHDDSLMPNQVQAYLKAPEAKWGVAEEISQNLEENRHDNAVQAVKEIVGEDAYAVLENNTDDWRDALEFIEERDSSDPLSDLLDKTGPLLMRYRMTEKWYDFPVPGDSYSWTEEHVTEEAQKLAGYFGVPYEKHSAEMIQLIQNASYGGSPEIVWYAEPKTILKVLTQPTEENKWAVNGTLTFHDPMVAVIDNYNGSGHDVRLKNGTITVPLDPTRIVIDNADGNGIGWDTICSLNKPYYRTQVDIKPGPEMKLATAGGPSLGL